MCVLRIGKYAELVAELLAAESSLGQHAVDCLLDHTLRMSGEHRLKRHEPLVAHVSRVSEIPLLFRLLASDADFGRIDHDDVVTRVHVRREHRLVLATDDLRDLGSQTAEDNAFGVDDVPLVLDIPRGRGVCLHGAERM